MHCCFCSLKELKLPRKAVKIKLMHISVLNSVEQRHLLVWYFVPIEAVKTDVIHFHRPLAKKHSFAPAWVRFSVQNTPAELNLLKLGKYGELHWSTVKSTPAVIYCGLLKGRIPHYCHRKGQCCTGSNGKGNRSLVSFCPNSNTL